MSTTAVQQAIAAAPPRANAAAPYLRRLHAARPRARRPAPLILGLVVVTALLFARVWQVTAAHSLSMDRDRLRHEVHALENRIRLSSDLAVQEALHEGLDYAALAKQGFQSPDPAVLVDVDLAQPFPRVVSRQGAMARLSADVGRFVRGILPGRRGRTPEDVRVVPVSAESAP
jgi:hypothetical protein